MRASPSRAAPSACERREYPSAIAVVPLSPRRVAVSSDGVVGAVGRADEVAAVARRAQRCPAVTTRRSCVFALRALRARDRCPFGAEMQPAGCCPPLSPHAASRSSLGGALILSGRQWPPPPSFHAARPPAQRGCALVCGVGRGARLCTLLPAETGVVTPARKERPLKSAVEALKARRTPQRGHARCGLRQQAAADDAELLAQLCSRAAAAAAASWLRQRAGLGPPSHFHRRRPPSCGRTHVLAPR